MHFLSRRRRSGIIWLIVLFTCMACRDQSSLPHEFDNAGQLYPINVGDELLLSISDTSTFSDSLLLVHEKKGKIRVKSLAINGLNDLFYNANITISKDTVFLPLNDALVAVSAQQNKIIWQQKFSNPLDHRSAQSDEHVVIMEKIGRATVRYHLIDKTNGQLVASINQETYPENKSVFTAPVFVSPMQCVLGISTILDTNLSVRCLLDFENKRVDQISMDTIYFQDTGPVRNPIKFNEGYLWFINFDLCYFNNNSTEAKWCLEFPHGMLTSRELLVNDTIFLPLENKTLYAINARTGEKLWEKPIPGTPSRLHYDSGQIYFIGGSDNLIYRINSHDGSIHSKMKWLDPGKLLRSSYFSKNMLVINDGHNWIVTQWDDPRIEII